MLTGDSCVPERSELELEIGAFGPDTEIHYRNDHGGLWRNEVVVMTDLGWGTLAPGESKEVTVTVNEHIASASRRDVGVSFIDGDGASWVRYLDGQLCPGDLSELRRPGGRRSR